MSTTNHATVSAAQGLRLIGPDDLTVPLTARLDYRSQDPYAVSMSLDAGRDEPVSGPSAVNCLPRRWTRQKESATSVPGRQRTGQRAGRRS
jgi:hypothetical protein